MFVRYQTLSRPFWVLSSVASLALMFYWCSSGEPAAPTSEAAFVAVGAGSASASEDEQYRRVLTHAERSASPQSKVKDALGKGSWKLNLYEDTGDQRYDRMKIDRNRDDVWDEAWTRKDDGHWERDGDGKRLSDAVLAAPAAAASAGPASAANSPAERAELEPKVAAAMNALRSGRASEARIKDFNRGNGPKVSLYDDDGDGRWDRAKVDYERDELWDEKWTHKPDGSVERKSEHSGVIWVSSGEAWVPKP